MMITENLSLEDSHLPDSAPAVGPEEIAQMGFLAAIIESFKPHKEKLKEIRNENFAYLLNMVVSLIPVLGEMRAAAILRDSDLVAAALMEGATVAEAGSLALGSVVNEGVVTSTLWQRLKRPVQYAVKYAVHGSHTRGGKLPRAVTLAMTGAEIGGLHGASALPSAIEIEINRWRTFKELYLAIRDIGSITEAYMQDKVNALKQPFVASAAAAFA